MNSKMLEIKKLKKKNPKFIRQDAHKKKKLDKIWRKPRGHHSKLRQQMTHRKLVKPGYGLPKELKGKTLEGKNLIHISKIAEIETIDIKNDVVIVSGKIGLKNRLLLLEALSAKKVKIANIKNVDNFVKEKRKILEDRKKKEVKPTKESSKKSEKAESIEEKLNEEDQKKLEKKEIDRLLTKKF